MVILIVWWYLLCGDTDCVVIMTGESVCIVILTLWWHWLCDYTVCVVKITTWCHYLCSYTGCVVTLWWHWLQVLRRAPKLFSWSAYFQWSGDDKAQTDYSFHVIDWYYSDYKGYKLEIPFPKVRWILYVIPSLPWYSNTGLYQSRKPYIGWKLLVISYYLPVHTDRLTL